jgi:hypothetical protein
MQEMREEMRVPLLKRRMQEKRQPMEEWMMRANRRAVKLAKEKTPEEKMPEEKMPEEKMTEEMREEMTPEEMTPKEMTLEEKMPEEKMTPEERATVLLEKRDRARNRRSHQQR